jgi:hypothetical protein
VQVDVRVPLGMVIEETAADHAQPGRVVVTGALPGYSAIGQVLGRCAIRDLKACLSLYRLRRGVAPPGPVYHPAT